MRQTGDEGDAPRKKTNSKPVDAVATNSEEMGRLCFGAVHSLTGLAPRYPMCGNDGSVEQCSKAWFYWAPAQMPSEMLQAFSRSAGGTPSECGEQRYRKLQAHVVEHKSSTAQTCIAVLIRTRLWPHRANEIKLKH